MFWLSECGQASDRESSKDERGWRRRREGRAEGEKEGRGHQGGMTVVDQGYNHSIRHKSARVTTSHECKTMMRRAMSYVRVKDEGRCGRRRERGCLLRGHPRGTNSRQT